MIFIYLCWDFLSWEERLCCYITQNVTLFQSVSLVLVIQDNTLGKCYCKRSVSSSLLWQGDLEGVLLPINYGIEILWHIETRLYLNICVLSWELKGYFLGCNLT